MITIWQSILQVPEDYDSLLGSLSDIINEASELESIEIGRSRHEILGGDIKPLPVALKLPIPLSHVFDASVGYRERVVCF